MKGAVCFVVFGLLAYQANGQAGGGAANMALLGAGAGMEMQELMMLNALGRGGAGGSAGGGPDPMTAYMMSQSGMLGGEMALPMMMLLGRRNGGPRNGNRNAPRRQRGTSMANRIAAMLGDTNTPISPSDQDQLWTVVQNAGHMNRILDAVTKVADRAQLGREGLPGINNMVKAFACPRLNCNPQMLAMCPEAHEKSFLPETFYVCPGCPHCPGMGPQMMSMMGQRGMRGPRNPFSMGGMSPGMNQGMSPGMGQGMNRGMGMFGGMSLPAAAFLLN